MIKKKFVKISDLKRFTLLLLVVSLMTSILIDTTLIKLNDLINVGFFSIELRKIIFSVNSSICLLIQFFILRHTTTLFSGQSQPTPKLKLVNKIGTMSYYLIIALVSGLVLQIFYFDYYYSLTIMMIIFSTYGIGSVLIAKAAVLFLSWYKQSHRLLILLYFLSMSLIVSNLILTSVLVNIDLTYRPVKIAEYAGGSMDLSPEAIKFFNILHKVGSILSFSSIWLTTSILMYSSKDTLVRQIRYWLMPIVLIIYFLISHFALEIFRPILIPLLQSDPVSLSISLTMIFTLSKPIGGLMFGIAFWKISRSITYEKTLSKYLILSGYGFLLLFSADQSTSLVLAPYPPFGVTTVTVLIIASYVITYGIYTSATLVSVNNNVRTSIHKIARESRLLDFIGKAEMEKEVTKIVNKAISKTEIEEPTATTIELDEQELKSYVMKVAEELRKNKR